MEKFNVEIRLWQYGDAHELAHMLNNSKIQDNLRDGIPYPYSLEDAKQFIDSMLSADKDKVYAFVIICDNKVVGSVGAFRKENVHFRTAEIGYYISEDYWGKGIATCAVKKVCEYIFNNTNIIRIYAEPFARNIPSCRVLEKSGFICEGILKSNAIKNGEIEDMKMYACLK